MSAMVWKENWTRKERVLKSRPGFGKKASSSTFRTANTFRTEVECGDHRFIADQPVAEGGGGAGPTPGQLLRSGIGACLAQGYLGWAWLWDVPLDAVEVEVTCELDVRGQMGLDETVPTGWQRIAWTVRFTSNAPEEALRRLFDHADKLSPMLGCLDPRIERQRTLEILRPT